MAIVSLFLALNGCSVEKLSPPALEGAAEVLPAVITNTTQGSEALSAVLQAKELVVTSTNIFRDLGFMVQSQMTSSVTGTSGTGSGSCGDYGTYSCTSTAGGTSGSYDVSCTFSLCRQNGFQYDGAFTAIGSADNFQGSLSGLKILNFQNSYKTLIGSLVGDTLTYTMKGSGDASNASYVFTVIGRMNAYDYYSLGQHEMNFPKLITNYSTSTDNATQIQTSQLSSNGKYFVSKLNNKATLTYSGFEVAISRSLTGNSEDVSTNGKVAVNYSPDSSLEGAFDVVTTVPVKTVSASYPPRTTQGTIKVNDTATAQYGSSDTLDITVAGSTVSFAKEFILMKEGDFYGMEQQLPIVKGPTGSATGTIMSVSALSTAPTSTGLECWTDVHVSYYTKTNPTTADSILWYVDFTTSTSTCQLQTGVPYEQATSSTGVAGDPCDVGLDINGADQDITSGGVEHFLAAALPSGYYVLSINNYSCSTDVMNSATIVIGDYLFGNYDCTYGTSDGDGSSPDAWCRLADVRVSADGAVDVISPDANLNPWHN